MNTNPGHHDGQSNMMDLLKTQMMTMTMMSSVKSPGNTGIFNVLYIFLITGFIDFFCKIIAPTGFAMAKKYYNDTWNKNTLINNLMKTPESNLIKSASITIQVNIADHLNVIGQAVLDYITNNVNTKHISYKKQNFILNQTDIIEISEDYFVKLTENKVPDDSSAGIEQTVELFSYSKSMQELRAFLDKITHEYKIKIENKLSDKMYYFNQHPMTAPPVGGNGKEKDYSKLPPNCVFTMKPFQTNRKFTNLFGPEIDIVRKRVEFFIKNKKWYDAKGIPYTLGLLLSGQAGAGKTSSIKCLANETRRHIININLNNDITKTQLENLFFNEMIVTINASTSQTEKYYIPLDQRIYVLEDIDCQSDLVMERGLKNQESFHTDVLPCSIKTNPKKPDTYESKGKNPVDFTQAEKIDLSFLLNLLDGILEIPGRIIIMTSNFPKLLDHALIRPGRIDVIADFKKCNHNTIIQMIEFFYDIILSEEEKDIIRSTEDVTLSPAEMGKLMFENFGDYKKALKFLASKKENVSLEIEESNEESNKESNKVTNISELPIIGNLAFKLPEESFNKYDYNEKVKVTIINDPLETPVLYYTSCNNKQSDFVGNKFSAFDEDGIILTPSLKELEVEVKKKQSPYSIYTEIEDFDSM